MIAPTTQVLTHSRMACFRACPRRHYLRYEIGIRPDVEGYALKVGRAFHAAVEAAAKGLDVAAAIESRVEDPYDLALVAAMYDGHCRRWADAPVEHVQSERVFNVPLRNPDTGAATPTWQLGGVIDRIVRLSDGRLALMEYKTTSRDFSPSSAYWVALHMDSQLSMYVIAAREIGYPIDTILYDVTRRPGVRPQKATPMGARKYTKAGVLYAAQRDQDETPEEYAARAAAAMAADPDKYFARIEIARTDQDLDDCRGDVWDQQHVMRAAQRSGRWYRNPQACFSPYACDFVEICKNRDLETHTPAGFMRVDDVHAELAEHATDGG